MFVFSLRSTLVLDRVEMCDQSRGHLPFSAGFIPLLFCEISPGSSLLAYDTSAFFSISPEWFLQARRLVESEVVQATLVIVLDRGVCLREALRPSCRRRDY